MLLVIYGTRHLRIVLEILFHKLKVVIFVSVLRRRRRRTYVGRLVRLLGCDLLCRKEATSGTTRTAHSVLMARLMEVGLWWKDERMWGSEIETETHLSLPGEPVHLFETSPGYTPFEDAIVLLCVDVQGLLVDGLVILDLVYWGIWFAVVLRLGVLVLYEKRLGCGCWRGMS